MIACTLSDLELRSIIESAFLPLRCNCTVIDGHMTVEVIDPASRDIELFEAGISLERLDTSRGISELIAELRNKLESAPYVQRHALAG